MPFGFLFDKSNPQTWCVPDLDKAFFDDWAEQSHNNVVPPIRGLWIFEGDVILLRLSQYFNSPIELDVLF